MKKNLAIFFLSAGLFVFNGCKKALKNVEDYFPKVKTVSAEVQSDGSVLVTGSVESVGDAPLEYVGASFSNSGSFDIRQNQLISNQLSTSFSVEYPASTFSSDSVYYFKVWAANGNGWAEGQAIKVEGIIAEPVTPPCTLTVNTVNIGGANPTHNYYDVTAPSESLGTYSFTGSSSSGPTVNFTFGSNITTGIYTTSNDPGPGEVSVSFYQGFISGALSNGSSVYVNTISPGVFDITICDAPWIYSSSTFYFNTRLTVPY